MPPCCEHSFFQPELDGIIGSSSIDVFYTELGGFDTHSDMKINLADQFMQVDESLKFLHEELVEQLLWENTTIVVISDFGRTLTPNSGEG